VGSSPGLPSNLGMSEGSLVGIAGQWGSWRRGSLMGLLKSGRLKLAIKGSNGVGVTIPMEVMLVGLHGLPPWLPSGFLAPTLVPDILEVWGWEDEKSKEELEESTEIESE